MSGCGCGKSLKFQKGDKGIQGYSGWSPVLQLVQNDGVDEGVGDKYALKFIEWTGGTGPTPADPTLLYLGSGGFVAIGAAYDLRGITGTTGATGATGNGIAGIAWTSNSGAQPQGTEGTTDTYTITYDDSSTDTFVVTNGADGATGATGAPGADASAFGYDNNAWTAWTLNAAHVDFLGTDSAQLTLNSVTSNLRYKKIGKTLIISGYAQFNVTGAGAPGGFWAASPRVNITTAISKTPQNSYNLCLAYIKDIAGLTTFSPPVEALVRSETTDYILFEREPYENDSVLWPKGVTSDYRWSFTLILEIV